MIEPNESKRRKIIVYPILLTVATMVVVADAIESGIRQFIAHIKATRK
jgi:hypothetical protein